MDAAAFWDRDWTLDPWFLQEEDEVFVEMGFPLEARARAAENLARVFTRETCASFETDPAGNRLALLLFDPNWPGLLIPLLEAGENLGIVQPWNDAPLLKRLTRREQFYEAALELRVFANLIRAGYRAERIPEARVKTADLSVKIGLEAHDVEVKAVHRSRLDLEADRINQMLATGSLIVPGLHLEFCGSAELHARARKDVDAIAAEAPAIATELRAAVERIKAVGAAEGVYAVGPYGKVIATKGPRLGSLTPALLPDDAPAKRVARAVRLVREAARQLNSRRGIVVLGVWRKADLLEMAEAIRAAAARNPDTYAQCHLVVLLDSLRDPAREYGSVPLVHAVQVHPQRQVTKAQLRFATIVAGKRGRPAHLIQAARPGEPGISLSTIRQGVTSLVLDRAKADADGLIRVRIDDYLPKAAVPE